MTLRSQQTIARPADVSGIGFLTGADVRLRFLPAEPYEGITFVRSDRPEVVLPAAIEYTVPRARRTALEHRGVNVEMIEHVMAALAGLQIDNCRVELNAPEPPGCDGSSLAFAEALLDAGRVSQGVPRPLLNIQHDVATGPFEPGVPRVSAHATGRAGWVIGYDLDYGADSPIPAQRLQVTVTPESFVRELAFARTFILETEVNSLRAQGYGKRLTAKDLLIYGPQGPIDNELRTPDECVRHKILDCLGDLALIGCDLAGRLEAYRSGHRLNGEAVRHLQQAHAQHFFPDIRRAA